MKHLDPWNIKKTVLLVDDSPGVWGHVFAGSAPCINVISSSVISSKTFFAYSILLGFFPLQGRSGKTIYISLILWVL